MTQPQPDALRIADLLEQYSLNSLLSPLMEVAEELRRQHVRIKELEAQLSATQPAAQGLDAERLRHLLCKMVDQLERRRKYRYGNAPGHCHNTPGIWDSDNGKLAGQKCGWCEVWQEALEVYAAAQAKEEGEKR